MPDQNPPDPNADPNANNNPPPPGDGDMDERVNRKINAAISAHHTRIAKTIESKFGEFGESVKSMVAESLKGLKPEPNGHSNGANGANGKGGDNAGLDKLREEYEARAAEQDRKFAALQTERDEERTNNLRTEEKSQLTAALQESGIVNIRGALALIFTEDKRVGRDDRGQVVWKAQRDGYVEDVALDKGIEEWLKSGEGKYYAAPRDVGGSGNVGGGRQRKGDRKPTRQELKHELVKNVLNAYR